MLQGPQCSSDLTLGWAIAGLADQAAAGRAQILARLVRSPCTGAHQRVVKSLMHTHGEVADSDLVSTITARRHEWMRPWVSRLQ